MADDALRWMNVTTLHLSVDSVSFGNTGVRVAIGPKITTAILPGFVVTPFEARKLADELMRVADEAEKVSL